MPSIRQLANDLDVNNKTVAKAYRLLERDSVIQTKGYRGTFVHPDAKANSKFDVNELVVSRLSETVAVLREAGATDSEIRIAFGDVMSRRADGTVVFLYYMLQYSPLMIAMTAGFTYFNLKRAPDARTTRRAELRPRRLLDFVSTVLLGVALTVFVAFVGFIGWLRAFDLPWFGGWWNALDLRSLSPIVLSLYFQIISLAAFRGFRIDNVNFEVYREDPVAT